MAPQPPTFGSRRHSRRSSEYAEQRSLSMRRGAHSSDAAGSADAGHWQRRAAGGRVLPRGAERHRYVASAATPVVSQTVVATAPSRVDASGTVARYDPATGMLTFQDGRTVRVTSGSGVWGPASLTALQPGTHVLVQNAEPVGPLPTAAQPGIASWRVATVNRVDHANGLIFLNDGTAVHVGPSTVLQSGNQRITLAEVQPGARVAIAIPATAAPVTSGATAPAVSALPRQTVVPLETPVVQIIVPR